MQIIENLQVKEKLYTEKYKDTPTFNLYKMKRGNGEGSALKTFGK